MADDRLFTPTSPYGVFRTGEALAQGVTWRELSVLVGREWSRRGRGVLLNQSMPPRDARQRAAVALGQAATGAVASHVTAARVYGFQGLEGLPGFNCRPAREPEHVTVDRSVGVWIPKGLRVHRATLRADDVVEIDGLRLTSPLRTAADLLLTEPRAVAVVALDSALRSGVLPVDAVVRLVELLVRRRGAVTARRHLELVDGRAESPFESVSRLHFVAEGLAPDDVQYVVRDASGFVVARADLLFVGPTGRRVLGEADGREVHEQPQARYLDARREERLRDLGYDMVRWTWADLFDLADPPAARVRRALARGEP